MRSFGLTSASAGPGSVLDVCVAEAADRMQRVGAVDFYVT